MKRFILTVLAGALVGTAVLAAGVADSARAIRPLLVGSRVPDVTLTSPDGSAVALGELVAEKAAIIVFYRGAW